MVLVGSKFLFRFRFIPIYYNGKNGMIKRKRNQKLLSTRKHSSRMHTTRFSHLGVGHRNRHPHWTETPPVDSLDRDPLEETWDQVQRPPRRKMGPGSKTGSDIIQRLTCGQTHTCENITLYQTNTIYL